MGKRTGRHMMCLAYALIVAKLIFSNSHANLPKSGEKCIFFYEFTTTPISLRMYGVSDLLFATYLYALYCGVFLWTKLWYMKLLQYCTTTLVFLNSSLNPLDCWIAGRWRGVRLKN